MTVLFGILSFSLSEARIMDPSARETIEQQMGSVAITVKNNPSIAQRMAFKTDVVITQPTRGYKISDNESPLPKDRVFLPKKDTTQMPGRKKGDRPGSITIVK